ncbi:hypothetical protein DSO57_1038712 [Entomophthora muscae]|uniref:Uncharacterized protein n=1 Tax=Entomophthora muscae TaxID=34485 RepID=A0ACC2TKU5_9FUNG|nr:hypothetical protein DSO57_1038712 [Entomophthora muscae]
MISESTLLQNLAPDRVDYSLTQEVSHYSPALEEPAPLPAVPSVIPAARSFSLQPVFSPRYTPWLLLGMLLMAANFYFTPVTSSLSHWTPV